MARFTESSPYTRTARSMIKSLEILSPTIHNEVRPR